MKMNNKEYIAHVNEKFTDTKRSETWQASRLFSKLKDKGDLLNEG
jgi:hypothetical protein